MYVTNLVHLPQYPWQVYNNHMWWAVKRVNCFESRTIRWCYLCEKRFLCVIWWWISTMLEATKSYRVERGSLNSYSGWGWTGYATCRRHWKGESIHTHFSACFPYYIIHFRCYRLLYLVTFYFSLPFFASVSRTLLENYVSTSVSFNLDTL